MSYVCTYMHALCLAKRAHTPQPIVHARSLWFLYARTRMHACMHVCSYVHDACSYVHDVPTPCVHVFTPPPLSRDLPAVTLRCSSLPPNLKELLLPKVAMDARDCAAFTAALVGALALQRLSAPSLLLRQAGPVTATASGTAIGTAQPTQPSSPLLRPLGAALRQLELTYLRPAELPSVVAAINAAPGLQGVSLDVRVGDDPEEHISAAGAVGPVASAQASGLEGLHGLVPHKRGRSGRQQPAALAAEVGMAESGFCCDVADEPGPAEGCWCLILHIKTPEAASALAVSGCLPQALSAFNRLALYPTFGSGAHWKHAVGATEALGAQLAQCHGLQKLTVCIGQVDARFVRQVLGPSLPRLRHVVLLGELSVDAGTCASETVVGMCLMRRADLGLPPLELTSGRLLSTSSAANIARELVAAGHHGYKFVG